MKNRRRGFTLVEMVIAITVAVIVFGMILTFCVGISDFSRDKAAATDMQEELARAERLMTDWVKTLDDAFNTNFTVTADNREVRIKSSYYRRDEGYNADNYLAVRFNEASGVMTVDYLVDGTKQTKTATFDYIKTVRFARGSDANGIGNVVKCVLTTEDNTSHTVVLHKASSSAQTPIVFNTPYEKTSGSYHEFVIVSSVDWTDLRNDNEVAGYLNLQELAQYATYDLSMAYQHSVLSLLRVQVDDGARMSLEAFTGLYNSQWRVRIFPAGGKVAYGLSLPVADFNAASHKIGFFINEGSTLYDGTPLEPMGYVRDKGAIGTRKWHVAASLEVLGEQMAGTDLVISFQSDIVWKDAARTSYTGLENDSTAQSYGLSQAVRNGLQKGLSITVGYKTYTFKEFQELAKASGAAMGPVKISMSRIEPEGHIRVQLSIPQSALVSGGGIYEKFGSLEENEIMITFEDDFLLPDGTPLKEGFSIYRSPAELGKGSWKKAVLITPAGDLLDGSAKATKGNNLSSYTTYSMVFNLHTPWTDTTHTAYENLQNQTAAAAAYGLSAEFFEGLYNWVFIGKSTGEIKMLSAMTTMKISISLRKSADGNTLLRFDIPTAQMVAAGYPLNITTQFLSVRFGACGYEANSRTVKHFLMPNGTPVSNTCFVRKAGAACQSDWVERSLFTPSAQTSTENGTLFINMFTNLQWPTDFALQYKNVQVASNLAATPLSESAKKSLNEKLFVVINGNKETLKAFNARTGNAFSLHVLNLYGCCALQLEISSAAQASYINGKTFSVVYEDGFLPADGATPLVPMQYTRNTAGTWSVAYGY